VACLGLVLSWDARGVGADGPPAINPVLSTDAVFNYEGAPGTPDADDPAIWVDRGNVARSLVIGTAKDAGLLVYDLRGKLLQAIRPPNAPHVSSADPPTPAGVNNAPDRPCRERDSRETFGRFNNVDIAYDVGLAGISGTNRFDVAVVSDRGCDRLRFYRIDRGNPDGPLVDITAADVPRVFPTRYDQPSPVQPSGGIEGWRGNPVDDQNTVYGLTVARRGAYEVFVSQRERGLVRQLTMIAGPNGTLTYRLTRTFVFDTTFELIDGQGAAYDWTPCREAVEEEPQSEGLVVDTVNDTLYVAFETIGLYKLPLRNLSGDLVRVGKDRLIEPVTSFGRAYRAIPDDDEFECEYGAAIADETGIFVPGADSNAGAFLQADLEGLAIIAAIPGQTVMLASSQGDSSFHFYYLTPRAQRHVGAFLVEGVGDTDGVDYAAAWLGPRYPLGLLVVQNGEGPEPDDTSDVNGYPFDGSTQFKYVSFLDTLEALSR
jgi:3-phytase